MAKLRRSRAVCLFVRRRLRPQAGNRAWKSAAPYLRAEA